MVNFLGNQLDKSWNAPSKVLILLASRNGSKWIREQLNSIKKQEHVDFFLLIGDDCSVDNTESEVKSVFDDDSLFNFLSSKTPSGSAGSNFRRIFCEANVDGFDYVSLADQDDIWFSEKLSMAINKLKENECDGYSASVKSWHPGATCRVISQNPSERDSDFFFEGAGQGCTFVIRSSFFREIQSFCRDSPELAGSLHYHDWLIYLLSRAWDRKWYFDIRPVMLYRQHQENEIGSRGSLKSAMRRLTMIRNGWYAGQIRAAVDIYRHAGGHNANSLKMASIINSPRGLARRLILFYKIILHGRRRLVDRFILAFSALFNWI